jgi:hypothetical protein
MNTKGQGAYAREDQSLPTGRRRGGGGSLVQRGRRRRELKE